MSSFIDSRPPQKLRAMPPPLAIPPPRPRHSSSSSQQKPESWRTSSSSTTFSTPSSTTSSSSGTSLPVGRAVRKLPVPPKPQSVPSATTSPLTSARPLPSTPACPVDVVRVSPALRLDTLSPPEEDPDDAVSSPLVIVREEPDSPLSSCISLYPPLPSTQRGSRASESAKRSTRPQPQASKHSGGPTWAKSPVASNFIVHDITRKVLASSERHEDEDSSSSTRSTSSDDEDIIGAKVVVAHVVRREHAWSKKVFRELGGQRVSVKGSADYADLLHSLRRL